MTKITFVIDGYLYLGNRFDAENYQTICAHGISAIINVTTNEPNNFSDIPGIEYLRCPIEDSAESKIDL